MRDLLVWGATGQAIVLAEFAKQIGFRVVALIDNDDSVSSPLPGIAVHYGMEGLEHILSERPASSLSGIAAIGGWRGKDRIEIHKRLSDRGLEIPTLAHPTAYVADKTNLGIGCQILANATIAAQAELGHSVIINTSASIDHECVVDDGVHIAPGAILAGRVKVGRRSFIGPGAVVVSNTNIGSDVIVGAGAVVTRGVPNGVTAYGSPARFVRKSDIG